MILTKLPSKAAICADIAAPDKITPYDVFLSWGNIIQDDFEMRNKEVQGVQSAEFLLPALNSACKCLQKMNKLILEVMNCQRDVRTYSTILTEHACNAMGAQAGKQDK